MTETVFTRDMEATTTQIHPEDARRAAMDRALATICPGRMPTLRELIAAEDMAADELVAVR